MARYSRSCSVCHIVSLVCLDDCDAMALIGQRRVLSTVLPRNKNLLHTCWMNCLALLFNSATFDSCMRIVSLHHIGLVQFGMAHAVVCLNESGAYFSPNLMLSQCIACLSNCT
jgi:hypothetical protein